MRRTNDRCISYSNADVSIDYVFWLESRITKLEHREEKVIDVPKHTIPMYTCITYPTECGCKSKPKSSKKKITNDDGPIGC